MRIRWPDCIAGLKQFDLAYWFLSVQVRTVGLDMFGPVTIFLFTATTIMIQVYTWGVLNPGSFQIDDHYVVQFLGLKRLRSKAVVHHWRPWTFGSRGSWCPQIHRPKFMFCWCHFLWLVASYCIIPLIGPAGQPMRFAKQAPKRFPQKDIVDNPLPLIRIRDTLVPEWCPKIYGLYIYIGLWAFIPQNMVIGFDPSHLENLVEFLFSSGPFLGYWLWGGWDCFTRLRFRENPRWRNDSAPSVCPAKIHILMRKTMV